MNDEFQRLIESLEAAGSKEEATRALERYIRSAGIDSFAYLGFSGGSPTEAPEMAGTYPAAWAQEYMKERLFSVDPVVTQAVRSTLPTTWGREGTPAADRAVSEMFERAARFEIASGLTVPVRGSGGQLATMTYASGEAKSAFERSIGPRLPQLHLAAFYFHSTISRVTAAGGAGVHLTPRETTCLALAAQGLTGKAIARVIDGSERVVKFHLDNARLKLGAANRQAAIHRASQLGLIVLSSPQAVVPPLPAGRTGTR